MTVSRKTHMDLTCIDLAHATCDHRTKDHTLQNIQRGRRKDLFDRVHFSAAIMFRNVRIPAKILTDVEDGHTEPRRQYVDSLITNHYSLITDHGRSWHKNAPESRFSLL